MTQTRILLVDDEHNILKALQRLLMTEPYELFTASSGHDALQLLQQQPVDLIISDMRMPEMNGAELMTQAAVKYPDTMRVILTGYADIPSTMQALNEGHIHRYMQKPWDNVQLKTTLKGLIEQQSLLRQNKQLQQQLTHASKALYKANQQLEAINHELEHKVQQRTAKLKETLLQLHQQQKATYKVLYNVVSINPDLDGGIAQNVSELCRDLASRLGLDKPQIEDIALAGLLFELGLLGVSSSLYQKPFHKLTSAERAIYLRHPQQAALMLAPAEHLQHVTDIIANQYERYNGGGIPRGIAADSIPIGARILAIARDYWGYQLGRLGKDELTPAKALLQVKLQQGTSYDPLIVRELAKVSLHDVMAFKDHSQHHMTVEQLEVGMVLQRALFNAQKILILPEGHTFNQSSIQRLKALAANSTKPLAIFATKLGEQQHLMQQVALDKALVS